MRAAIIVPHAVHSLIDVLPCAAVLRSRGWRVVILDTGVLGEDGEAHAARYGIELRRLSTPAPSAAATGEARPAAAPGSSRRIVKHLPLVGAAAVSAYVARSGFVEMRSCRRKVERLFDDVRPEIVVVFDDRCGGVEQVMLTVAKLRNARTLVAPNEAMNEGRSTFLNGRRALGWTIESLSWSERGAGRLLRWLGIEDVAEAGKGRVYWRQPSRVLGEFLAVGSAENPWVRGGNRRTDLIAVSSETYRRSMVDSRVAAEKLVVVGYPRHDEIASARLRGAALRRELAASKGIAPERPVVLIGLSYFAQALYQDEEMILDNLVFIARTVRERLPGHSILYARHPRITPADLRKRGAPLFSIADTHLADPLTTYEAIAISEIYVPFYSGTTYGALAAGCIVLGHDFVSSPNYDDMLGWSTEMLHARTRQAFIQQVDRLADPDFRRKREAIAKEGAAKYGCLDGRNAERLASAIEGSWHRVDVTASGDGEDNCSR